MFVSIDRIVTRFKEIINQEDHEVTQKLLETCRQEADGCDVGIFMGYLNGEVAHRVFIFGNDDVFPKEIQESDGVRIRITTHENMSYNNLVTQLGHQLQNST